MAIRADLELDGLWSPGGLPMLRWLLLVGIGFVLVTGVNNGWIELRWGRLFSDLGVPYVADPGPSGDCAGERPAGLPAAASSSREARKPSR